MVEMVKKNEYVNSINKSHKSLATGQGWGVNPYVQIYTTIKAVKELNLEFFIDL